MARIRTIKPDFFRHFGLYTAEIETGLPLRVSFAGLLTACDREGRFRWKPEALKLDCLPYDVIDFSRVLDALLTRGFIVRYTAANELYGWVPTFLKHQVINNRERESDLPNPEDPTISTRAPRDSDACPTPPLTCTRGNGIGNGNGNGIKISRRDSKSESLELVSLFDSFWQSYPNKKGKLAAQKAFSRLKVTQEFLDTVILPGIERAKKSHHWQNPKYIPYPATWLNGKRWEDEETIVQKQQIPADLYVGLPKQEPDKPFAGRTPEEEAKWQELLKSTKLKSA